VTAPLADALALSPAAALGAALAIGVAFGWSLERAGLGSAPRLAAQFYLRDLTVFKVMFSAIVTAMLGTCWLARLGWLDLSRVYVPETFLLPQLAGGLVFGVGFVIAGLCPGTSCVAAATGRGDGIAVVAGMFAGVLGTGLAFGRLRDFYEATARGPLTLPDVFHVTPGIVVLGITAAAIAGFIVASHIEGRRVRSPAGRRFAVAALALAGLAAASVFPPAVSSGGTLARNMTPSELARLGPVDLAARIQRRDPDLRIVDVRTQDAFDAYHVPTAEHLRPTELVSPGTATPGVLVVYGEDARDTERAAAQLTARGTSRVYALEDGMAGWMSNVMTPVVAPDAATAEKAAFARVAALSRYFGGSPRVRGPHDVPSPRVASSGNRRAAPVAPFVGQPVSALARWRRGC